MTTIISYPDRTLLSTLSGGSWQAELPLANLQNQLLSKKARSTAASGTQTIDIDLGVTGRAIKIVAILAHNLSYGATVRARGYSDSGRTTLVSGADTGATTYAFPQTLGSEVAANYPKNWIYCFTTAIGTTARYWRIEIVDTENSAGYIELGRLWLGTEITFPFNCEYGFTNVFKSNDIIERSLNGVAWGEKRTSMRVVTGKIPSLDDAAKQQVLIMQKVLGTVGELLFVLDTTANATNMLLEAMPALMSEVSPLSYPYFTAYDLPFSFQELV